MRHDDARPGQPFRHVETGTVARFVEWRARPEMLGGGRLMVLHHPKFGECRWHPRNAERYAPTNSTTTGPQSAHGRNRQGNR